MKTKIEIKTFGGTLLFTFETEDNSVKKTVEEARRKGADLEGAYLRGADLEGAYLRGADLEGAYLRGADLEGADLRDADLEGADLRGADLEGADLRGADLEGADLEGADLRGAYLEGADLRGAENLPQSLINICTRDMLYVFNALKEELPFLRAQLIAGKVNGSQYEGQCACLVGSLAGSKGQNKTKDDVKKFCEKIKHYDIGLHNPGENWFWNIREGDTPKKSPFAKLALKLIDEVLEKKGGKK